MSTPEDRLLLGGDAALASRFLFEVDGVAIGLFSSVRGLAVSAQVEELQEGGNNSFSVKLPGRLSWPNIVFSHGLTQSDALFEWMQKTSGEQFAAQGNKLTRSTGAITALSSEGDRLRSWSLQEVFPVRWKGPDFDGADSSVLSEELEITHHGFTTTRGGASR